MSSFFLIPSLAALRSECDRNFPNRDRASDGWIGDPSHAARLSDHNPCWTCTGRLNGAVYAVDIDISPDGRADKDLRAEILKAVIGDERTYYVISNWIIYSRTYGWAARRYTGTNGHTEHVHVSGRRGVGEFDTSPWFAPEKPRKKPIIYVNAVADQFRIALDIKRGRLKPTWGVRAVQAALNDEYRAGLATDGIVGQRTIAAWARHERAVGGRNNVRVPDGKALRELPIRLKWKDS